MISVIIVGFLFWTVFLVHRARYLGYSPAEEQRIRGVVTETCGTPIARLSTLPNVFVLWQRKQNWRAIATVHLALVVIPLRLMSLEAMGIIIAVTGLIEGWVYFRFWGTWRTALKSDCQRYLDRTRSGTEKLDGMIALSRYRDLSSGHRIARVTHWKDPEQSVTLRVFYGHDHRIFCIVLLQS